MNQEIKDRSKYESKEGIATWWQKDGAWHIGLPCPQIVNGLRTGGFRYTKDNYQNKADAISAIKLIHHRKDNRRSK